MALFYTVCFIWFIWCKKGHLFTPNSQLRQYTPQHNPGYASGPTAPGTGRLNSCGRFRQPERWAPAKVSVGTSLRRRYKIMCLTKDALWNANQPGFYVEPYVRAGRTTKKGHEKSWPLEWEQRESNPRPSACKADALNQLSYAPKLFAPEPGLEPGTLWLTVRCSNQLSYSGI